MTLHLASQSSAMHRVGRRRQRGGRILAATLSVVAVGAISMLLVASCWAEEPATTEPAPVEVAPPEGEPTPPTEPPATPPSDPEPATPSAEPQPPAPSEDPPATPGENSDAANPAADGLTWLPSLDQAIKQASESRQPILVRVGADWCGWCAKLEQEIAKPAVQKLLKNVVMAYVDVDRSDDARTLGVSAVPALKLLSSTGRPIDSRDGFLPETELLHWLQSHLQQQDAEPVAELIDGEDGEPNEDDINKLIKNLSQRDPLRREAAVRRLVSLRGAVANAVVAQLKSAKLSARLAALEILQEWRAPLDELDPWLPETLTPERTAALATWAADELGAGAATEPELSSAELATLADELARYVDASEAEAESMRERLARRGRKLLPEIESRLQLADTDGRRQRLAWLRLRLLASEHLAVTWPQGLAQLASADSTTRHKGAAELANHVTSADDRLLLALFSDPDQMVRELSLRALRQLQGEAASTALTQLLADPEPNVRAAVLKELAGTLETKLVDAVVDYLPQERDADLLVHAVRLLRGKSQTSAVRGLTSLLSHDDWRVRAEAADALGETLPNISESTELQADAYTALVRSLDDSDGFVVSKALAALQSGQLVDVAVEPLANAAVRHPDLAPQIVEVLASSQLHERALPHLRKFAAHERAEIRAAAIAALIAVAPDGIEEELKRALEDADPRVRTTAARGLFGQLTSNWFGELTQRMPQGTVDEYEQRLSELYEGKRRPDWITAALPKFEAMTAAEAPDERLQGALVLVAFGKLERGLEVLKQLVRGDQKRLPEVAAAIQWLPQAQREDLFKFLDEQVPRGEQAVALGRVVAQVPGEQSRQWVWQLLGRDDLDDTSAMYLWYSLQQVYSNDNTFATPTLKEETSVSEIREQAGLPPDRRRIAALALLLRLDAAATAELASAWMADVGASAELRRQALILYLHTAKRSEARQVVAAALASDDEARRELALRWLALGASQLLPDDQQTGFLPMALQMHGVPTQTGENTHDPRAALTKIDPALIQGLTGDTHPPVVRALANYLLVLLDQPAALQPLLALGDDPFGKTDTWRQLAYRAIAAADNDQHNDLLTGFYEHFRAQNADLRDFYWTIRTMTAPDILQLRGRIRKEVGMDNLR